MGDTKGEVIGVRKYLAVDLAALAVYAAASLPDVTGVAAHEWLGLVVFAVLIVHVACHVDWVVDALRSARGGVKLARHGRLVLDALIAVVLAVTMVSGIMISGAVLPTLGLYAQGYYFWDPLHAVASKALLALILLHVAANASLAFRLWKGGKCVSPHAKQER